METKRHYNKSDKWAESAKTKQPIRSTLSILMASLEAGDYFYTDKPDKTLTALAFYYKRKITTERYMALTVFSDKVTRLVKVNMLK